MRVLLRLEGLLHVIMLLIGRVVVASGDGLELLTLLLLTVPRRLAGVVEGGGGRGVHVSHDVVLTALPTRHREILQLLRLELEGTRRPLLLLLLLLVIAVRCAEGEHARRRHFRFACRRHDIHLFLLIALERVGLLLL